MEKHDTYSVCCMIIFALALIGIIVLMGCVYTHRAEREGAVRDIIKQEALRELSMPDDTECTLTFTGHYEETAWEDYTIYIYTLRVGGKVFLIKTKREEWAIYGVSVEREITEMEAKEWEKI